MASANSGLITILTHAGYYELQQRVLGHLNGFDLRNLRLVSRSLNQTLPVTALTRPNQARCQDSQFMPGGYPPRRCLFPDRLVAMQWCDNPTPDDQRHAPGIQGSFNVCSVCLNHNRIRWGSFIEVHLLDLFRAGLCKPCSLSFKRQHPQGIRSACSCRQDTVSQGWYCYHCTHDAVNAVEDLGFTRYNDLIRTRKRRVFTGPGRRGRKVWQIQVRHDLPVRKQLVCPMPDCGNPSWTRHHRHPDDPRPDFHFIKRRHPDAAWACLVCQRVSCFPST